MGKTKLFQKGNLVLGWAEVSKPTEQCKLAPNWERPYQITDVIHPRAYRIENLDGSAILHTWKSKNLKNYYQ